MKSSAKRIFEKIKLLNHTPTQDEAATLQDTVWQHKLSGSAQPFKKTFKSFFSEEPVLSDQMTRSEVSEYIVDAIEDKFDLHFSDGSLGQVRPEYLPIIKKFAVDTLEKLPADEYTKRATLNIINNANEINTLLLKLSLAAA